MPLLEPKSWLESKVLWVNGLTVAAMILTSLSGQAEHVPAGWMPYIVAALAATNFALRFLTTTPVASISE